MSSTTPAVVLLVQSDPDNREMYCESLRHDGFHPIATSTAGEALTIAPTADVIVTGIQLPGRMDGVEFISRLKRDQRTKGIPVIVVTAAAGKSERERTEKAGCDAFLAKPCLPGDLVREVRRLVASAPRRQVRGVTTQTASDKATDCQRLAARPKPWTRYWMESAGTAGALFESRSWRSPRSIQNRFPSTSAERGTRKSHAP